MGLRYAALVATTMKFQSKANWHYRKLEALNALRRRLVYEQPESLTADNIAAISNTLTTLTERMQQEWQKEFSLDWTGFPKNPP